MYQNIALSNKAIALGIIVSALGFFVDLYDIMALAAIGEKSLLAVGVLPDAIKTELNYLQSMQMFGMLIGGFLWGIIGDKYGRLKVLFGSIMLYSGFTLLNAFVADSNQYAICRFLAGLGLAGELGAGITLVSEQMSKERRGLGPAIIAGFGVLGAIAAVFIGKIFDWKTVYIIGGLLGFMLFILRIGVVESGLFKMGLHKSASRGNFMIILHNKKHFKKFIYILLAGIPAWFVNGVMMQFSNYIAESMGMDPLPDKAIVITCFFISLCVGDIMGGIISQWLKSRKKSIYIFLGLHFVFLVLFFAFGHASVNMYYTCFAGLGFTVGFIIQLFTLAAENFGTNIRNLVTSSGLNLVRAWVIPFGALFTWLTGSINIIDWQAAAGIAFTVCIIAIISVSKLDETFYNDLSFENE